MSAARRPPVAIVGVVKVSGPNAQGYYRLKRTEPDGTPGDTSAGTLLEPALEKATEINDRVTSAAGPKAVTALDVVVAAYLAARHSPYKNKKPWNRANKNQIEDNLSRCIRGFGHLRAMDVTRELCDRLRAQAGTETMMRINTTILRAFLRWGQQHGYFTPLQAELLPRACSMPALTVHRSLVRADENTGVDRARMNGQAETYVRDEDAPSRDRIVALRTQLKKRFPLWSEQFQLTAHDVHLGGCAEYQDAQVLVDLQVDAGGSRRNPGARRVRPKRAKTRVIPVGTLSFTGFALRDALRHRVQAALEEQEAGTNSEALLFSAQRAACSGTAPSTATTCCQPWRPPAGPSNGGSRPETSGTRRPRGTRGSPSSAVRRGCLALPAAPFRPHRRGRQEDARG